MNAENALQHSAEASSTFAALLSGDVLACRHAIDEDGRTEATIVWGRHDLALAIDWDADKAEERAWAQAAERFTALAALAERRGELPLWIVSTPDPEQPGFEIRYDLRAPTAEAAARRGAREFTQGRSEALVRVPGGWRYTYVDHQGAFRTFPGLVTVRPAEAA